MALRRSLILAALLAVAAPTLSMAASPYLVVPLPRGVTVELPRNWRVISDNQLVTLDAAVKAQTESATASAPSNSELPFAANYHDDRGAVAAMFNIRYYPDKTLTQNDAREVDLAELDQELRGGLRVGAEASGGKVLQWLGTQRIQLGDIVALVTEYTATSSRKIPFRYRLVRVLNGSKSFTIMVAYREDAAELLRPICDRIVRTIRV